MEVRLFDNFLMSVEDRGNICVPTTLCVVQFLCVFFPRLASFSPFSSEKTYYKWCLEGPSIFCGPPFSACSFLRNHKPFFSFFLVSSGGSFFTELFKLIEGGPAIELEEVSCLGEWVFPEKEKWEHIEFEESEQFEVSKCGGMFWMPQVKHTDLYAAFPQLL